MSSALGGTPTKQIILDKGWLDGTIINAAMYGVDVALYVACFRSLLQKTTRTNYKRQLPFLIFIVLALVLSTVFTVSMTDFSNLAFIENRNYPGGPGAWSRAMFHIAQNEPANVTFVLLTWGADMLFLWRYMIIYRGCSVRTSVVMALPCLMFTTSFSLGILFLIQWSESSPWGKVLGVDFTLPFLGTSLALNILSTTAIVLRLLHFRYRITSAFGTRHGAQYTSIVGIIIESAAIYSTFSVIFLVTFAIGNPISTIFLDSLSSIQMFASMLIIWRVTQGRAWSKEKTMETTTLESIHLPSRQSRRQMPISFSAPMQGIIVTTEVIKDCEARYNNEGDVESESPDRDLEASPATV
ncbi:hypothetical protein BJ138DRAFT_1115298 [Hygrophoropsis aurantiaca]|uniref:Uncharacterized protein n=1 Tax=Hygrophoropsis aurantiaca TaxID=72124 RepID=A0ACB8A6C3_9AGAM|nr:hypothetical protein BJ138DRAFT_1115298 [Hygrophoropsis aurantiaca]